MWFFVIGDLLIFGVYFITYVYYRGRDHDLFWPSQARLNLDISAMNTVVLLTSSLFVALGTQATRAGKTADGMRLFGIAMVCGAVFPVLKLFEYVPEIIAHGRRALTHSVRVVLLDEVIRVGLHFP